ncbi:4248_t:CDS:1 [Paraglomus occultum]|uniref:4248_t:CDS:1 n=1 Tax=Paraglomus occultum TaxID=144539 RepID=A0A9N8WL36_9GLOM|nr:4248_t:CDS:1 [Paraglomus occultum]
MTTLSELSSTSDENITVIRPPPASKKATENARKLKQTEESFLNAFRHLGVDKDDLSFVVSRIYNALKSDPFHSLYELLDHIQIMLTYVCDENSAAREQMRSDLVQLAAEHVSPRPNARTSTSLPNPNTCTGLTPVSRKRPASYSKPKGNNNKRQRSELERDRERELKRMGPHESQICFENPTGEVEESNQSTSLNGHDYDGQRVSLSTEDVFLTSDLNETPEDNVPVIDNINSLAADMISGVQLPSQPCVHSCCFCASPTSYDTA